jgi:hypothetical protein
MSVATGTTCRAGNPYAALGYCAGDRSRRAAMGYFAGDIV